MNIPYLEIILVSYIIMIVLLIRAIIVQKYLTGSLVYLSYEQLVKRLHYMNNLMIKELKRKQKYEERLEDSKNIKKDATRFFNSSFKLNKYILRLDSIHKEINRRY